MMRQDADSTTAGAEAASSCPLVDWPVAGTYVDLHLDGVVGSERDVADDLRHLANKPVGNV